MLTLEKTTLEDLEALFTFQTHPDGIWMAAFTPENSNDKAAYMAKFSDIIANPAINNQTIRLQNEIVGSVSHFDLGDETHVTYWIDRKHWGKGIASEALQKFVANAEKRPLFALVAFDNLGSQKVLEKAGFVRIGNDKGFANARGMEIEELLYRFGW